MPVLLMAGFLMLGIVIAWTVHRNGVETERTIRLAIEQGLITNPKDIASMRAAARLGWGERLAILGSMVMTTAAAVLVAALVIIATGMGMPMPLFPLAAFLAVCAIGLVVSGRRFKKDVAD